MAINYTEINTDDIVFGPLRDNVYLPTQKLSWISKKDKSKISIQTPRFITETYGIPRQDIYNITERQRAYYKVPLCHNLKKYSEDVDYNKINDFYNKMKELDAYFSSDEFKKKMFDDKNINKYEYQPIVREFEEEDNIYKPPYIKLKIDLDFTTSIPKIKLYNKTEDSRELVNVEAFKDVTDHIKYLTKVRFIICIDRLYLMKSQGISKQKYGVFLKILTAECENKKQEEKPEVFNLDFLD